MNSSPKEIWDQLSRDEEIVVTNNGKPTTLLVNIPEGNFDETLASVRQAKTMRAFASIREEAAERGYLSNAEIEGEIQAYRREKREKA